ncbi:histone deacetylase 11 isoform X3 [Catharus ustulatus]|uniref:histone deacetylase 11 isoform X3 n=1 Tax=Catharus ustulatus TaxID=91951 RepID=UPI0014079F50|nr:histone deacetylase 11 isoform X3 [Catharus ustulatus]
MLQSLFQTLNFGEQRGLGMTDVEFGAQQAARRPHRTELYEAPPSWCWPIVYSPEYNITFMGLEKLHPFDAGKWGKVINFLKEERLIADDLIVQAREATDEDLLVVHSRRYLNKLKWSFVVATITEIPPVAFLPNFVVQRKVLKPLRTQTGGTIMAGKLAVDRGWAINVGGGFHHCSSDKGGGFCAYADITLAIKFLFERVQGVSRATIIDLDAHQGIVKRDELVFRAARSRGVPVLMVTSGGYQKRTARIIADSILNLHSLGLLGRQQAACALGSPSLDHMVRDSAKDFSNLSLQ